MKNKIILKTCGAILATLFTQNTSALSIVDVGVGLSNMDRYILAILDQDSDSRG